MVLLVPAGMEQVPLGWSLSPPSPAGAALSTFLPSHLLAPVLLPLSSVFLCVFVDAHK